MSADEFNKMTMAVLKTELRDRALPVSGNKTQLVQRLVEHEALVNMPKEQQLEHMKKVTAVMKGASTEAAQPQDANGASGGEAPAEDDQGAAGDQGAADGAGEEPSGPEHAAEKRIARFGKTVLKDEEKVQKRAERFKTVDPIADSSKVESRAARFGILTESVLKEKEVARAKRFNMDTPELMAEKKKARDARFSAPVPPGTKEIHTVNEIAAMIKRKD